ncbi:TRAP transporter permease [Chloroflexota bacterium]
MKIGNHTITKDTLIIALGAFIILFNFYCLAWLPPDPYIQRGLFLSVFIILCILLNPPKSIIGKITIVILSVMALAGSMYAVIFADKLADQFHYAVEMDMIIFPIFIIGLIGVLSRVGGGWIVNVLMIASLLYLFVGQYIPGIFGHNPMGMQYITSLIYTDIGQGVFGNFVDIFVRIVSIFMIFAAFLYASGLGDLFTAIACRLAGNATGGPAKVSVISSGAFGMISGSPVANVVATGSFTIPTMKSVGYKPEMAATIEALASTGGMLMPPIMGAIAFLMADILAIPYLQVMIAALVPAFLWYYTCYVIVHFYALSAGVRKWRPSMAEAMAVIKAKFHFLFAIFGLVGALFYFASAEQAAFYAVVFMFLLTFIKKETRLNKAKLAEFIRTYVRMFGPLFVLCAAIAVFVSALTGSGAHLKLGTIILGGFDQWYVVLILVFALVLLLGMGITPVGPYLAGVAIAAPILGRLGFNILAVHFFIFYAASLAPITPPVCLASFNAARIAGTNLMRTGIHTALTSIPLWIVPFILVRKNLLFTIGTPTSEVLTGVAIVCIGILLFVVGTQGYFARRLKFFERVLSIITGLMIVQPISDFYARIFLAVGSVLLVYWLLSYYIHGRKVKQLQNLSVSNSTGGEE